MKKFNAMTASEVEFLDYLDSLECDEPGCVSSPALANALVDLDFQIEEDRYDEYLEDLAQDIVWDVSPYDDPIFMYFSR